MSYVVLARKWRPQTFADLTGQQHVARTLTNAIEQARVPHAMLFTGARGVGKTSSARILAMALNCAKGPTPSPCGVCDACREIQRGQSVDVLEIDGASNRGINEIRELRDGVRYAPNRDRYKVYIIDEVHMLTTEAFNALLKTLEEPPPHVVFLFATTEAHKIPVTILSRCQRFDFRRIPHAEIVGRLRFIVTEEQIAVDDEVLGLVARQAQGGMRDALSLLDQIIAFAGDQIDAAAAAGILGAAERRRMFTLSQALITHDVDLALRTLQDVADFGVDLSHFSADFVSHLRDLTVVSVSKNPELLTALTDQELRAAREQVAQSDVGALHRMFSLMVEAAEAIARSNHAQLVFEMALVRMAALEPVSRIDDVLRRLDALARGNTLPSSSTPSGGGQSGGQRTTPTPAAVPAAPTEAAPRASTQEVTAAPAPAPEPAPPPPPPAAAAAAPAEAEPTRVAKEKVVAKPAAAPLAVAPIVSALVHVDPVAVEATPSAALACDAVLTAEQWVGFVDQLAESDALLGVFCLEGAAQLLPGRVLLSLAPAQSARWTTALQARLAALIVNYAGVPLRIEAQPAAVEEQRVGLCVARIRKSHKARYIAEALQRAEQHPALRSLERLWPTARISWSVDVPEGLDQRVNWTHEMENLG